MEANVFVDILEGNGISFFTGVPDSLLKLFCDEVIKRRCIGGGHIVAHNEGGSVALAAGYYLATGRLPCVYMQNSGIGNALNPVVSLTHPKVCGIPMLFVIGWRGEPGTWDEPQHVFQGEITLRLLSDMGMDYAIVDESTRPEQLQDVLAGFAKAFSEGRSAAFVVRKGAFTGTGSLYGNSYTLNREKAVAIVSEWAQGEPLVSTTGKISRELFEIRQRRGQGHEGDFLTVGAMGHSSMIALGIGLQQPNGRVWCLDGDGAVLMHTGGLSLIGAQAPVGFIHVVFNNCAHETVGGIPTAAKSTDLLAAALACGYRHGHRADDEQSLAAALEQAKKQRGPVFIEVFVCLGSRGNLGRPTVSARDNKRGFMGFLIGMPGKGETWV